MYNNKEKLFFDLRMYIVWKIVSVYIIYDIAQKSMSYRDKSW